ncbi:MAG: hypothetical protein ACQEXB_08210 [Bacillota bacterium]
MCVSYQFIHQEAYDFSEKIRKQSLYKFVRTELSENHFNDEHGDRCPLISKVVLEDNHGNFYHVAPNSNGLKFAKQELTFKEYKRLEKKETRNALSLFMIILVSFGGCMATLIKIFT